MQQATLPNGVSWTATKEAHRRVWRYWQALVTVALTRGEGVAIDVSHGAAVLSSVYAPQWEAHRLVIYDDGRFCYASEQNAPAFQAFDAPMPSWLA